MIPSEATYITKVLARSRRRIERDAGRGITLHQISASAAYFLYDLCRCNDLDDRQTQAVMGEESWRAVQNYLDLVPARRKAK